MRLIVILAISALLSPCAAQDSTPVNRLTGARGAILRAGEGPVPSPAVRAELLDLERRWDDAVVAKDTATLRRILAPEFVYIGPDGTSSTREQMLTGLLSPSLVIKPFTTRDVAIRVYGTTAVLTGWFEQSGSVNGKPYTVRRRYTDVYARHGTRWVAVSAQASPMP
jgi:ketosteroid isomerase-like protein